MFRSMRFPTETHIVSLAALALFAFPFTACGGISFSSVTPPASVGIHIAPDSLSVAVNQSAQIVATVFNSANPVVVWQVNGVIGGDATNGKISSTGLYTAPALIPSPAAVKVIAIPQADSSQSAQVMLTVVASSSSPVTVSPVSAVLDAGSAYTFAAAIHGTQTTAVTWQVNGVPGGDATHGTISSSGLYTATLNPPPTGGVTVTAVDPAGAGSGDSAATVVFSNASLHGAYAFSLSGADSRGFLAAAGSFTADGKGNITGGLEDVNSRTGVTTSVAFTGGSFVFPEGRGVIFIRFPGDVAVWNIALVNDQHAVLSRASGAGASGPLSVVTGSLDRQDASAFNVAALNGNYVASFFGVDATSGNLRQASILAADGAGAITNGVLDQNDAGVSATSLPISNATYTLASTGRGTLSFTASGTTQTFAIYAVNPNEFKAVETDSGVAVVGELNRQASGPFSNAALNGGYAFTVDGTTANGAYALGGVFTANGAGALTSGIFDENDAGTVTSAFSSTSASYAVAANGRATASMALNDNTGRTLNFVLYPKADGSVAMLDIDSNVILAAGQAMPQTGPFAASSLDGAFALNWNGTLFSTPPAVEDITGVLVGASGSLGVILDVSTFNSKAGFTQTASASGPLTVAPNGRGTAALLEANSKVPLTQALYLVNRDTALTLDIDSVRVLTGAIRRQY